MNRGNHSALKERSCDRRLPASSAGDDKDSHDQGTWKLSPRGRSKHHVSPEDRALLKDAQAEHLLNDILVPAAPKGKVMSRPRSVTPQEERTHGSSPDSPHGGFFGELGEEATVARDPLATLESEEAGNNSPSNRSSSKLDDMVSAKLEAYGVPSKGGVPSSQLPTIEIAPGVHARLRGARETWASIEQDSYIPTQCFCCQTEICCIMDANYVLCPACKVVSPLENGVEDGGVGLGFTFDDLQKWQCEIMSKRR